MILIIIKPESRTFCDDDHFALNDDLRQRPLYKSAVKNLLTIISHSEVLYIEMILRRALQSHDIIPVCISPFQIPSDSDRN